jgi:WD40 repeat protein
VHGLTLQDNKLWLATRCEVQRRSLVGLQTHWKWDNGFAEILTGLCNIWAVTADRRHVLAGGRDGVLRLLKAQTGTLVQTVAIGPSPIRSVALDSAGEFAAVGTWRGEVVLVRVPDLVVVARSDGHRGRVEAVAFLPGGLLASASADRSVRLWQRQGQSLRPGLKLGQPGPVVALAPCPAGKRLAVLLAGERAVRLWSLDRLEKSLARLDP